MDKLAGESTGNQFVLLLYKNVSFQERRLHWIGLASLRLIVLREAWIEHEHCECGLL